MSEYEIYVRTVKKTDYETVMGNGYNKKNCLERYGKDKNQKYVDILSANHIVCCGMTFYLLIQ